MHFFFAGCLIAIPVLLSIQFRLSSFIVAIAQHGFLTQLASFTAS
jgi:hypothetical protein